MRTDAELREAIAGRYWFHSIELRPGIVTPGHSGENFSLNHIGLPGDMTGLSVLDIGCWDGFFSFECECRGAARVVASDIWETAGRGGFDLAREELDSKVVPLEASVYDLPGALQGERFDLVLLLGVLYHLKEPLAAIEAVAQCARPGGILIVETLSDVKHMFDPPLMTFHPDGVNGDLTSFWSPNIGAVSAMAKFAGFSEVVSTVQCYAGSRTVLHAKKASDEEIAEHAQLLHRARHSFRETRDQPPAENAPGHGGS